MVSRLMHDVPPAHYTFKIESLYKLSKFLSNIGEKKYKSGDFEVGGYKWRLSLYPNGDENRNGADHISLLVLSEANNLPLNLAVKTFFKLFVYDQIRDKYLTVQDVSKKEQRFHALKNECGFSQFLLLNTFSDKANGYLIDDCCIFGAEVIVTNRTGLGEIVSINKPKSSIFTYKRENFSKLEKSCYDSCAFEIAGWKWLIKMDPKKYENKKGISLFFGLADDSILLPGQKVYVEYKLRVKSQLEGKKDAESTGSRAFACIKFYGSPQFLL